MLAVRWLDTPADVDATLANLSHIRCWQHVQVPPQGTHINRLQPELEELCPLSINLLVPLLVKLAAKHNVVLD